VVLPVVRLLWSILARRLMHTLTAANRDPFVALRRSRPVTELLLSSECGRQHACS
jgi:hypothetical protein